MDDMLTTGVLQSLDFFTTTDIQNLPAKEVKDRFKECMILHQSLQPRLVSHKKPAQLHPQYEAFLNTAEGTLGIRWEPDLAMPWSVAYADHWASNLVLTVDGMEITIQSALIYLGSVLSNYPDLMTELVNHAIWSRVLENESIAIEELDIDAAIVSFRKQRGLFRAEATEQWLKENGLTYAALKDLITQQLKVEKLQKNLAADKIETYFEAHRHDFDSLTCLQVSNISLDEANTLVNVWKQVIGAEGESLLKWVPENANIMRTTKLAKFWPQGFNDIKTNITEPMKIGEGYVVGCVINRQPAVLNSEIRTQIQAQITQEWLTKQRKLSNIRWHWV
jgi:putative peptide maturation system protein